MKKPDRHKGDRRLLIANDRLAKLEAEIYEKSQQAADLDDKRRAAMALIGELCASLRECRLFVVTLDPRPGPARQAAEHAAQALAKAATFK